MSPMSAQYYSLLLIYWAQGTGGFQGSPFKLLGAEDLPGGFRF